jgi:hypothetical protein
MEILLIVLLVLAFPELFIALGCIAVIVVRWTVLIGVPVAAAVIGYSLLAQ